MTDALRNALKLIDKHSVATVRTNSKDRGDWAEDMAYVGKVARDALAASAAPAVPPGWQPIETAPKDGTKVLTWWPDRNEVCVAWHEARTSKTHLTPWRRDLFGRGDTCHGVEPTHWMPLPTAPTGSAS